jgi:anaerobic ribonucleoside-triphosphate reductase
VISVDKIESINVLKDKNTTAKYGDLAKHGVIEINTKKITVREITLTEKKYEVDDDNKVFEKVEIEASFPRGVNGWREFLQKNIKPTVAVETVLRKALTQ